jgi:hypothetical protein
MAAVASFSHPITLLCRERRQGIDGFAELTGPYRVGG